MCVSEEITICSTALGNILLEREFNNLLYGILHVHIYRRLRIPTSTETNSFVQFETIINVLASSFRFILIPMS